MMSDLVLELESGQSRTKDKDVKIILPNSPGQRYILGSLYPGDREGEEFIFCRFYKESPVDPTHCVVSVDKQGQYWIGSDTNLNGERRTTRVSSSNTFVNSERVDVLQPRLLNIGDIVSLGNPRTCWKGPLRHVIFHVQERILGSSGPRPRSNENENSQEFNGLFSDSPSVLEKIMNYLPLSDLQKARLVCKKWKSVASKVLEKKAAVSFAFGVHHLNPYYSTRVFRYLKEMKGLKIQNIHIRLDPIDTDPDPPRHFPSLVQNPLRFSPKEPGQKMMDDLRKLLKSPNNFSRLFLQCRIDKESDFLPFSLIFQNLEKLDELQLKGSLHFLPAEMPPLPMISNLKKFTQEGSGLGDDVKWVSHIVSLFSKTLEHFTCQEDSAETYLQAFLKEEVPHLKGIAIEDTILSEESLSLLLQLKNPLTHLKINYYKYKESGRDCTLLETLLSKNSTSLSHLTIRIGSDKIINVKFPSAFPNLKELVLKYSMTTRVSWGSGSAPRLYDYKEQFPSLQRLSIVPQTVRRNDPVFSSFFPEDGDMKCKTVKDLWVAALPDPELPPSYTPAQQQLFKHRIDKIGEMFPNADKTNFFQKD